MFAGPFRLITPILWVLFAGLLMSIYLLTSWMPLALESGGMSPPAAALMNTMLQFGGVVGGIGAALLIGRIGLPMIVGMLGGAWLLLVLLAIVPLPDVALAGALGLCGICAIGGQTAINGCAGLIYPAPMRARGVGAALGVGRLGSIAGPLVGALALDLGHGVRSLFVGPLLPLGLGVVAAALLVGQATIAGPRQTFPSNEDDRA